MKLIHYNEKKTKTEKMELQGLVHVCQNGGRTENQKDLIELI